MIQVPQVPNLVQWIFSFPFTYKLTMNPLKISAVPDFLNRQLSESDRVLASWVSSCCRATASSVMFFVSVVFFCDLLLSCCESVCSDWLLIKSIMALFLSVVGLEK